MIQVVVLVLAFVGWVFAYTCRLERESKARQREVRGILRELERREKES